MGFHKGFTIPFAVLIVGFLNKKTESQFWTSLTLSDHFLILHAHWIQSEVWKCTAANDNHYSLDFEMNSLQFILEFICKIVSIHIVKNTNVAHIVKKKEIIISCTASLFLALVMCRNANSQLTVWTAGFS